MCAKAWVLVDLYICLCNKLRQINFHKWFRKLWNVRQQNFINWQYSRKPCSLFITNGRLLSNHLEITLCHLFIPDDYITDLIISVYQITNRIKETGNWNYFFQLSRFSKCRFNLDIWSRLKCFDQTSGSKCERDVQFYIRKSSRLIAIKWVWHLNREHYRLQPSKTDRWLILSNEGEISLNSLNFIDFIEFNESGKSLKHELGSI